MQAPSEEEEEFHSVSLLFSFRLFVPNRQPFSLLILLFSAKTPEGRPSGWMCGIPKTPLGHTPEQIHVHVFFKTWCVVLCVSFACMHVCYLLVVLPCIWMIHFESLLISLELKGRTRTATFTDAPDMIAVLGLCLCKIPCISLLKETQKKRCLSLLL